MRHLMTVRERLVINKRMQPHLALVANGALLLLPHVQLVPALPSEQEVKCGALDVELRMPGRKTVRVPGRILETELPFHVHCRVLVLDGADDIPEGTEVWGEE